MAAGQRRSHHLCRDLGVTDLIGQTLGRGPFKVIYADPAWTFETHSEKGKDRSPEKHYDCMPLEEICALPVSTVASRDAWLFLWTTWPHLPQALKVMDAWGFQYSGSGFLWAKTRPRHGGAPIESKDWDMGLGYTTRKNTEPCILGKRGNPQRLSRSVRELLVSPRREHSRKPDEAYDRIEAFARGPYLEMFSRTDRPHWTSWGKETGKFSLPQDVND